MNETYVLPRLVLIRVGVGAPRVQIIRREGTGSDEFGGDVRQPVSHCCDRGPVVPVLPIDAAVRTALKFVATR